MPKTDGLHMQRMFDAAACRRLAVHFLQPRAQVTERQIVALAAMIRQAVDDWLKANPDREAD